MQSRLTWSIYTIDFYVNATTGLTVNDNGNLSSISDLSFSNYGYNISAPINGGVTCNLTATQKSKSFSGDTATYVVTLSRNVMGFYTDKVDKTLTYFASEKGTEYSLKGEKTYILVEMTESEPYDIQILNDGL